jgi:hypothetical protein
MQASPRNAMRQFEFKLITLDRVELRTESSEGVQRLNTLGADGWQIVHVREDPQHNRDLVVFLQREQGP